jgi:Uma2 family endonuclease
MGVLTQTHNESSLGAMLGIADVMELRRFTRDEFYAMDNAGIFDNDARVELIDGRIIRDMSPIGGPHAWSVEKLNRLLVRATLETDFSVRVQSSISLPGDRELQPDFVVYTPTEENATRNPSSDQVILAVEVAVTSIYVDRTEKMQLYAEAGIPTYWVVDVPRKRVFVHEMPEDGAYAKVEQKTGEDRLDVCGKSIRVADMF